MSDLSKRIRENHGKRNWHRCHCECVEHLAAAEIEALEAQVVKLTADIEQYRDWAANHDPEIV